MTSVNFTSLCRCCGLEYNLMYDIFCDTCSNAQTYYEVVMECAPIKLFRDDGLPSLICHRCVLILETFVAFRRKCLESELILKRLSDSISQDKRETPDIKRDNPALGNISEESDDIDDCTEPEIKFYDLTKDSVTEQCPDSILYDKIKTENTTVNENRPVNLNTTVNENSQVNLTDVKIESESISMRTSSYISLYEQEMFYSDQMKRNYPMLRNVREMSNDTDIVESDRPEERSSSEERPEVRSHDENQNQKLYACNNCEKSFSMKSFLDRHERAHTGKRPYSCNKCKKSFDYKSNLIIHRKIHTDEKSCAYDKHEKTFDRESHLYEHQVTHSYNTREGSSQSKSSLDQYQRVHSKQYKKHKQVQTVHGCKKSYTCNRCKKTFSRESRLNEHSCKNRYSCDECRKSFKFKSDFDRHQKKHSDEKPYACDQCDKSFKHKWGLGEHRNAHTGETPFSCDRCGKSFKYSSSLYNHQRTHLVKAPFTCSECKKSFKIKSTLWRHYSTHFEQKPYTCDRCGDSFKYKRELGSHRCDRSFNVESSPRRRIDQ